MINAFLIFLFSPVDLLLTVERSGVQVLPLRELKKSPNSSRRHGDHPHRSEGKDGLHGLAEADAGMCQNRSGESASAYLQKIQLAVTKSEPRT